MMKIQVQQSTPGEKTKKKKKKKTEMRFSSVSPKVNEP